MIANRYELHQSIGSGGMGDVFRGTDIKTGETVAIKQLKSHLVDSEMIARFRREGEVLRQLNHPNIVRMLDAIEADGIHYLVMEFVEGGDLSNLATGNASINDVLQIAIQIADALTRTHFLNIIHRDLKPANILLTPDGTPKVTDFGIAQVGNNKDRLTESGAIVGTFAYLSPEACIGMPVDARADIWAFGVVLYELLTGKRPFEAESAGLLILQILQQAFPDPQALRPDIPDPLNDLIYRMLEKSADARIPSVRLVGAEIEMILKGQGSSSKSVRLPASLSGDTVFATPAPVPGIPRHNLPAQTTAFVGREEELGVLRRFITDERKRLVTMVGPGGMGKTRLAIECGHQLIGNFSQGALFVPLDKHTDSAAIPEAIADAADHKLSGTGTPKEQILSYLANKHLLLILDNFEHLITGATLVAEILAAAPDVTVLATSRERLNLTSENLLVLGGMDIPDWETPADALRYSAMRLFLQSAQRIQVDFEMTVDNMNYIARVVRLVDGMPLGILLAAAWVDVLSVEEIAREIQNSVGFLESDQRDLPERQHSMRAVFEYSWRLLNESERDGLARMSVFRGGCTRAAAQAVSGASIRLLANLVNKSLLRRDQESGRYEMHMLMQQFADEQLSASADASEIRARHSAYYLNALADMEADLKGKDQVATVDSIRSDFENVRVAWQWAFSHQMDDHLLKVIEPLQIYCQIHSRLQEELDMIRSLKEAIVDQKSRLAVLAEIHDILLTYELHGFDHVLIERAESALDRASALGDPLIAARAQVAMGNVLVYAKRYADGLPYLEKSQAYYEAIHDAYHQAGVLQDIGFACGFLGMTERAKDANQRCLELNRQIGNLYGIAAVLNNLNDGNHEEAYTLRKQLGDKRGVAWSGVTIALVAIEEGDIEKAQRLIEEALQIIEEINSPQASSWVLIVYCYSLMIQERYDVLAQVVDRLEHIPVSRTEMLAAIPLMRCACALSAGNYALAKEYLKGVLAFEAVKGIHEEAGVLAAVILEQEGSPELALTLYTVGVSAWSSWGSVPLLNRTVTRIKATLSEEAYQQAVERAEHLTLDGLLAIYEQQGLM